MPKAFFVFLLDCCFIEKLFESNKGSYKSHLILNFSCVLIQCLSFHEVLHPPGPMVVFELSSAIYL